jgi:hypothetical protein
MSIKDITPSEPLRSLLRGEHKIASTDMGTISRLEYD